MAAKKTTTVSKMIEEEVQSEQNSESISDVKTNNIRQDNGPIILGIGLLVFGVLLLGSNLLNISFSGMLWPFIFIIPGALLFVASISSGQNSGEGLAIVGGILSMLGFVFLMQTITGFWATWAYIWALVAPTSVGLSQMLYGNMKKNDSIVNTGWKLTRIGLIIFGVGFVFFELIIGVSGFGLRRFGLPVLPMILIFAGGFIVIRSLFRSK